MRKMTKLEPSSKLEALLSFSLTGIDIEEVTGLALVVHSSPSVRFALGDRLAAVLRNELALRRRPPQVDAPAGHCGGAEQQVPVLAALEGHVAAADELLLLLVLLLLQFSTLRQFSYKRGKGKSLVNRTGRSQKPSPAQPTYLHHKSCTDQDRTPCRRSDRDSGR